MINKISYTNIEITPNNNILNLCKLIYNIHKVLYELWMQPFNQKKVACMGWNHRYTHTHTYICNEGYSVYILL